MNVLKCLTLTLFSLALISCGGSNDNTQQDTTPTVQAPVTPTTPTETVVEQPTAETNIDSDADSATNTEINNLPPNESGATPSIANQFDNDAAVTTQHNLEAIQKKPIELTNKDSQLAIDSDSNWTKSTKEK